MKWKPVNSHSVISDCRRYRITKFVLGGEQLCVVYHGDEKIGSAPDSNAARKIASRHAERTSAC